MRIYGLGFGVHSPQTEESKLMSPPFLKQRWCVQGGLCEFHSVLLCRRVQLSGTQSLLGEPGLIILRLPRVFYILENDN